MDTISDKNLNTKESVNVTGLESKILEYENNHSNGMGRYFTLDEVNGILDRAIKTGRQVA